MITPKIILPYLGSHGSIPSGYVRETELDSKVPRGFGTIAINTLGGSDTHGHTSGPHLHTMNAHTHTYSTTTGSNSQVDDGSGSGGADNSDESHTHTGTSGSVTGGSLLDSATIGTGSSLPPYYSVIFIRATQYTTIPQNAIVYRNDTEEPEGFGFTDGSGFSEEIVDVFLRGASTGAGYGSSGGTLNHSHSYNHGHTASIHSHATANSDAADNSQQKGANNDLDASLAGHVHSVSWDSASISVNSVTANFSASGVQPAFYTLRSNQNVGGNRMSPTKGDIALWLDPVIDIPIGWNLCNGDKGTPDLTDLFVKIDTTPGLTGGSHTHSHIGVASHTHTYASGSTTHNGTLAESSSFAFVGGNGHTKSRKNHTHDVISVSSQVPTWANSTIDTDTVNNEPAYRTVAYIQFEYSLGGAPLSFLM